MLIAEVSKKYDLTTDTIRYYERIGLIPTIPRTKNGIRDFDEESCRWIEFIKCMRNAGMEIEILLEYVNLFKKGKSTVKARKKLLEEQREKLVEFLKNNNVDVLICGGIGQGAKDALSKANIQLFGGVSGNADNAINEYLLGQLNTMKM